MHKHGKLVGSHLDSHCQLLSKSIAQSTLDYIEDFTPALDTEMTLSKARTWAGDCRIWKIVSSSAIYCALTFKTAYLCASGALVHLWSINSPTANMQ